MPTDPEPRTLERGMRGPDVAAWRLVVGAHADEFDETTERLTKAWQKAHSIDPDGVVGQLTRAAQAESQPGAYPFVAARNYTHGRFAPITLICIHTMESQELAGTALSVAQWLAGATAPQASAHFCVDSTHVIQCVRETDTAWGAPGANSNGLHIEHAGRASQTPEQWADAYSEAMLHVSARLCAELCRRHGIPIKRLGPADLVAGAHGICGHVDVTNAFHKGTHTDPGPGFVWDHYLELVTAASEEANA